MDVESLLLPFCSKKVIEKGKNLLFEKVFNCSVAFFPGCYLLNISDSSKADLPHMVYVGFDDIYCSCPAYTRSSQTIFCSHIVAAIYYLLVKNFLSTETLQLYLKSYVESRQKVNKILVGVSD